MRLSGVLTVPTVPMEKRERKLWRVNRPLVKHGSGAGVIS